MADELAEYACDTSKVKELAHKTFDVFSSFFDRHGMIIMDICLMITKDGSKLYYEITQDCSRIKLKTLDGLSSFDKDIWRAGGSSELVATKWNELQEKITLFIKNDLNAYFKSMGLKILFYFIMYSLI